MSRVTGAAAAVLAAALLFPSAGEASGIEIRGGGFFPRADANLFDDTAELFTVERDNWQGFAGGIEYSHSVTDHFELGFHIDGYGRRHDTVYRDFVDSDDFDIPQSLRLTLVPVGVSVRFLPTRKRAPVAPYVALGVDAVGYNYEEWGDFIDFQSPDFDISSDSFESSGAVFGYHAAAGLRVAVGTDFAITTEVRYLGASRKQMDDDFRLNEIDVSGTQVTVGLYLRF